MKRKVILFLPVIVIALSLSLTGYMSYHTITLEQENSNLKLALDADKQLRRIDELTNELSALQQELSSSNNVDNYLSTPVRKSLTCLFSSTNNLHPEDYLSPAVQKKYAKSQQLPVSSSIKIKELYYSKISSTQYNAIALCQYSTSPKSSSSTVTTNLLLGLKMEFHNEKWLLQDVYLEQYFNRYINKTGGTYE